MLARPPDHHLTIRQLRTGTGRYPGAALLEPLAVDSVYSIHDEFDRGLDSRFWTTSSSQEASGGEGFVWDEQAREGGLIATTGSEDDSDIRLYSRLDTWNPGNRCAVQIRLTLPIITNQKLELGFVNTTFPLDDVDDSNGAVLVKATPTANMPSFGVAILDRDDDATLDVVAASRGAAVSAGTNLLNKEAFSSGPHTFLVWMNEHNSVTVWLDGKEHGSASSQPASDVTSTLFGRNPRGSIIGSESGSYLWLYLQNRAANETHTILVDYIQAWQERNVGAHIP